MNNLYFVVGVEMNDPNAEISWTEAADAMLSVVRIFKKLNDSEVSPDDLEDTVRVELVDKDSGISINVAFGDSAAVSEFLRRISEPLPDHIQGELDRILKSISE